MIFKVHSFHESNRNDEKICPRWKITRDKAFAKVLIRIKGEIRILNAR